MKKYTMKIKLKPAAMDKERWAVIGFAVENTKEGISGTLLTLPLDAHGWDGSFVLMEDERVWPEPVAPVTAT